MLTPVEMQGKTFKSGGLGYDKKDVEAFSSEEIIALAVLISISLILLVIIPQLGFTEVRDFGNIFIDLLMGALAIYCLRLKGYKKFLALLPAAFIGLSFGVSKFEYMTGAVVHWFPYFIRSQYNLLSFSLILFFYLSYLLTDWFLKMHCASLGLEQDTFKGTDLERTTVNLLSVLFLISISILFHFLHYYLAVSYMDVQIYALFAGAFILLYNGRRGYNSKWFEYGGYAYYPVHILIIALIFYLITL